MKMNICCRIVLVQVCLLLFCTPLFSCSNKSKDSSQNQSEVVVVETETSEQSNTEEDDEEEVKEEVEIPEEFVCTNTLYKAPYLIFQAGLSSKPSDFYLTAYDTSTDSVTPINKGFHRQYFIRNEDLYFSQHGKYYKSSIESINVIEKIEEDEFDSKLFNDDERKEYAEELAELPETFKELDYYHINQVLKGHFTSTSQEETLLLTGDEKRSSVGIIQKDQDQYIPSIRGEFGFPEKEVFPLWQSMVVDIDHDGLDEIVVVGHDYDYHYNPTIVFVWDYDVQNKTLGFSIVGDLTKVSDPELIEKNQEVYLQYTFEDVVYKLKIDVQPEQENPYNFVDTEEPLAAVIFSHKPADYFPSFSFLENFEQSSAIVSLSTDSVENFPCVTLPPSLFILPDASSEEEQQFVNKQNKYLLEFVSMLKEGIDPFNQAPKNPCEGMQCLTQMVSVCQHSSLTFVDYQQYKIHSIESIFTVSANNEEYVVVTAKGGTHTYVFLFTSTFELLDIYWEQGSCSEGDIETIVSLEKPSYFWICTYAYRGPYLLRYFNVEDEKLKNIEWYCTPGMIRKNGKVFFEFSDGFMYKETKGSDSGMYASEYVDPFTQENCNKEFRAEMEDQYDSTYTYYFCLRHGKADIFDGRKVIEPYSDDVPDRDAILTDGRYKYHELYWFYGSFEQFEMEISDD